MPLPYLPQNDSDRLDRIALLLERMNSRDRLRTWGAFLRSLINLIPIAFMLASAWYLYQHGDELLEKMVKQSAEQAAQYSETRTKEALEQLQNALRR